MQLLKQRQRPANSFARLRAFAVDRSPLRLSLLAAAKLFIVGVPFSDVSFRAFTASPTVEKGTPTAKWLDNRSIAESPCDALKCILHAF
jgi:hypothetical protein